MVRIPIRRGLLDTTSCDKVCQWLMTGRWFSLGTPVSSTNKTDRHDITEILLKVASYAINLNLIFIISDFWDRGIFIYRCKRLSTKVKSTVQLQVMCCFTLFNCRSCAASHSFLVYDNWNIVESGIIRHKPKPNLYYFRFLGPRNFYLLRLIQWNRHVWMK
jgi:hypothetical protein